MIKFVAINIYFVSIRFHVSLLVTTILTVSRKGGYPPKKIPFIFEHLLFLQLKAAEKQRNPTLRDHP